MNDPIFIDIIKIDTYEEDCVTSKATAILLTAHCLVE